MHGSSGTGGRPTLVAYSRGDLRLWARMCARALAAAGATPGSIVHNAYGYGLFTGGLGIHQGAIELGATVVPVSGGMTAAPGHADQGPAAGHPDLHAVVRDPARRGAGRGRAHAGQRAVAEGGHLRRRAVDRRRCGRGSSDLLGIRALDIYGLSEVIGPGVACECLVAADGLHVNEDHFLVEALDPVTGDPVPDGTSRRADVHHADQGGAAAAAVPDRRHRRAAPRHLPLRPHAGEDVQGDRPQGRHARGQGRERLPERDRARPARAGRTRARLPAGGRRARAPSTVSSRSARPGTGWSGPQPDISAIESRLKDVLGLSVAVRLMPPGSVPRTEVGKAVRVARWRDGEPPLPGIS